MLAEAAAKERKEERRRQKKNVNRLVSLLPIMHRIIMSLQLHALFALNDMKAVKDADLDEQVDDNELDNMRGNESSDSDLD